MSETVPNFYIRVPKDPVRNLLFRKSLLQQAERDERLQQQLWLMCKYDLLFFVNVFLYVFEPRSKRPLPFITWECQDRAMIHLRDKILDPRWIRRDVPIEKSRDMGVTWICLAVFIWLFIFHDDVLGCIASRVKELVEDKNNHKSLFWKLDYFLGRLPMWMRPPIYRASMKMMNLENGSSINGDSTNPDMFRGDRALYIFLDEFAAVSDGSSILTSVCDVTFCVIANSTHQGVRTAFYEMVKQHRQVDPGSVIRMHWSEHPFKSQGMYRSRPDGKIDLIDKAYVFQETYRFIQDGKLRSPAYDNESKTRHARHMAQEWDIDPVGADWQYFKHDLLDNLLSPAGTVRPPLWRGEIEYLIEPIRFVRFRPEPEGRFLFWCELPDDFAVRDRDYGGGIDCGRGVGSSNSALCIADKKMRELVCEFADPHVKMDEFAEICAAVGQCFGGISEEAFLVWEANGPGVEFCKFLVETIGYRNVYMRTNERTSLKRSKSSREPGWWASKEAKQKEYGLYEQALRNGEFINRSEDNVREHFNIIWTTSDRIVHNGEMDGDDVDPAGAGYNHGDRVTAAVLCNKAIGPIDGMEPLEENAEYGETLVIPGTFSERFAEENEAQHEYSSRGW